MKYRQFGSPDVKVSVLGFGAMRLPEKNGVINEKKSRNMLYYAIDHGLNYIDTAWPYHKEMSEQFLGKALKGPYGKKVKIATKLPCWLIEKKEDCDTYLNKQLKRLHTDHINFYLLHGVFSTRWKKILALDIPGWMEKAVKDGRIGYIGFSFHGTSALFKEMTDTVHWDFCQIQYNYMNEDFQAGTKGLDYAAQKGIPVIVMEPLLGGILANPQGAVKTIWDKARIDPVDVAFRWLWQKPGILTVLSGMSSLKQVKQNISLASSPAPLTEKEQAVIREVISTYNELNPVPCTGCEYCMPCPSGVNIPRNVKLYNQAKIYNHPFLGKAHYNWHTEEGERASACTGCGVCEEKCPQGIKITGLMPEIHQFLLFKEGEV